MDPSGDPLRSACTALWTATLALMVAYMKQPAPAHRLLLARRIAANFETLSAQPVFSAATRRSFERLQRRWEGKTGPQFQPNGLPGRGWLARLLSAALPRL